MLITVFGDVLASSVSISVVLLPLLLLSARLNRIYQVKWKYYLWLLIAVRMLIVFPLPHVPAAYTLELPNYTLPADRAAATVLFSAAPETPAPYYTVSAMFLLAVVWVTGAAAVAGFHLLSYRSCRRTYWRWSIRCRDRHILTRAESLRKQLHIRKLPEIYICSNVPGPMILGVFRPLLLLPDIRYSHADLDYILRHELIHRKRNDIWYKLLLLAVISVHWFNPLSYLLLREAANDLEMLCDDRVVQGRGSADCQSYGRVILQAAGQASCRATILSTSFHGGARSLQSRLRNLLSPGKHRGTATYLAACAAAVLISGLIICLPASASTAVRLQDQTIQIPNGVRGIDVSAYQGEIDWRLVSQSDVRFAFVRASYGLEADHTFAVNAAGAGRQGLDVGAWHYATFADRETMRQQADFFLQQLQGVELTLPAVLCIQTPAERSKVDTTGLCIEFLQIVADAGYPVALHTYSSYLEESLDTDRLQDIPKWIANYRNEPEVGQHFWQYTSNGTIDGIEGLVDINVAYAATP